MTVDYVNRLAVFHCDECPEHLETEERGFMDALAFARSKGWRTFTGPDKQAAHACPACVSQFAKSKRR